MQYVYHISNLILLDYNLWDLINSCLDSFISRPLSSVTFAVEMGPMTYSGICFVQIFWIDLDPRESILKIRIPLWMWVGVFLELRLVFIFRGMVPRQILCTWSVFIIYLKSCTRVFSIQITWQNWFSGREFRQRFLAVEGLLVRMGYTLPWTAYDSGSVIRRPISLKNEVV